MWTNICSMTTRLFVELILFKLLICASNMFTMNPNVVDICYTCHYFIKQMMFASIFTLCMLHQAMAYLNAYDQDLNFACPKETQFVSHIESIHDNHKEDRMFDMSCSDVIAEPSDAGATCYLTGT